jgi:hypothetical protein
MMYMRNGVNEGCGVHARDGMLVRASAHELVCMRASVYKGCDMCGLYMYAGWCWQARGGTRCAALSAR